MKCNNCGTELFECDVVKKYEKIINNNADGYYGNMFMPVLHYAALIYRCPKCFKVKTVKIK